MEHTQQNLLIKKKEKTLAETLLIANLCIFIFIVIPVEFFRAVDIYDRPIGEKFRRGYVPYAPLLILVNMLVFSYTATTSNYVSTVDGRVCLWILTVFLTIISLTYLGKSMSETRWRNLGYGQCKTYSNNNIC